MSNPIGVTIGYVSPNMATSPYLSAFKSVLPAEVHLDIAGLQVAGNQLFDLRGKTEFIVKKALEQARSNQWQGMMVSGAPVELLNPDLFSKLSFSLDIPVAMALPSSIAALKSFAAKRILLMTPFDEPMNKLIRSYLAEAGVEAVSPPQEISHYTDAVKLEPEQVYLLTKKCLEGQKDIDAIYFQGAILDPLKVLERMELEFKTSIVASNPAMLWFVLSKLGLSYPIRGYGKLLAQWPKEK
jgi:hypothetical protein